MGEQRRCPRCDALVLNRWDTSLRVEYVYCYACGWNEFPTFVEVIPEVPKCADGHTSKKILSKPDAAGRQRILFWLIKCEFCQKPYLSRSAKRTICARKECISEKARRMQRSYRLENLKYKKKEGPLPLRGEEQQGRRRVSLGGG